MGSEYLKGEDRSYPAVLLSGGNAAHGAMTDVVEGTTAHRGQGPLLPSFAVVRDHRHPGAHAA
jgi:hypothetical protein